MSGIAPPMSAFAADAEANYRLSVAHYLAALRIVPQPLLPTQIERVERVRRRATVLRDMLGGGVVDIHNHPTSLEVRRPG